jgi:hypothetical protein
MKSRALSLAALALLVGLYGWTEVRPAAAQALDAGKPPAQIFSGTCSACHRSTRGLVRSISAGALPGFLRQHYTTGNDMAGTMAAYVLGNGGTDRVAEPPPKREARQEARPEPKQRAKSDSPEVAARNPEQKDLSRSAKQKAARKGAAEPSPAARDTPAADEPEKTEAAKPGAPADEPPKAEAVECKIEAPAKQTAAATDDSKPGLALPEPPATAPRQPTALLTLPGFPAPIPEPEPEPVATAAAPATPECDPAPNIAAAAVRAEEPPTEQQKEQPAPVAPPAVAEAPGTEPLRSAAPNEAAHPTLDIMQEEVHAPRPPRASQQKRAPPPQ